MLSRFILTLMLLVAASFASEARAERRVALVIGNAQYAHAPALRNPKHDAADMAAALRKVGFDVVLGVDLDQRAFAQHIEQFARMLDGADVAMFYYAGHGLQINDKNYLVSVNAQLTSEFLISSETIELDAVVRLMESKTPVNLVFLDACRNNPLAEDLRRNLTALKRSAVLGRGLARVEPSGRDTLIAFAAAPGQEAADGADRNSPFTAALLRHIVKPAQEVSVMLKDVAADVRRDTRNAQRPQQISDMTRTFYFTKGEQVATANTQLEPDASVQQSRPHPTSTPQRDARALEVAFWNAAQAANECDAVRAYLNRFPDGVFVELAKIAERRLCAPAPTAAVDPPQAAAQPLATSPPPNVSAPPSVPAPVVSEPAPGAAPQGGGATTPEQPQSAPPLLPAAKNPPAAEAPRIAAAPPAPAAAAAVEESPDVELARSIQRELVRVGCSSGEANGDWDAGTEEAVQRFNEHARWRFDPRRPSPALLGALERSDEHACPLECPEGFQAQGLTCVAIERAAPPATKKAARPPAEKKKDARPAAEKRKDARPAPEKKKAARPPESKPQRRRDVEPRDDEPRRPATRRTAPPASARGPGSSITIGGRQCRLVPRSVGGSFIGDTITVCD